MDVPTDPKVYHIVHLDRLPSILADGCLWSDFDRNQRELGGTAIGIAKIKQRRLEELTLESHPGLHVGDCVPFYFCPRSVMLYMLHMGNNQDLPYSGGQRKIIHLEADFHRTVEWARLNGLRWAFTDGNAGSYYFTDWSDSARLDRLNWTAIQANDWRNCKEDKQAEFLVERMLPWELIERIGVIDVATRNLVEGNLVQAVYKPTVQILKEWYY
jgi:hypothetical protein